MRIVKTLAHAQKGFQRFLVSLHQSYFFILPWKGLKTIVGQEDCPETTGNWAEIEEPSHTLHS